MALVFGGRCSKAHHDHAAAVVLVAPVRSELEAAGRIAARIGSPAAVVMEGAAAGIDPGRAELAASIIPGLDAGLADELRVRYLGWQRGDLYEPITPAPLTGPEGSLDELVDGLVERCRIELEHVRSSRRVTPPAP